MADSTLIAAGARATLEEYEFFASVWWSPLATPTVPPPKVGGGGTCEPSSGGPPCMLGRRAPCPPAYNSDSLGAAVLYGRASLFGPRSAQPSPCLLRREIAVMSRARDSSIATLDGAAAFIPGDRWIIGQLTYYLVQARGFDRALAAADACRAGDA